MFVWMSWNFARFHEIFYQRDAENFTFLSWQTKKFYSKKKYEVYHVPWIVFLQQTDAVLSRNSPIIYGTEIFFKEFLQRVADYKTASSENCVVQISATIWDTVLMKMKISSPKFDYKLYKSKESSD